MGVRHPWSQWKIGPPEKESTIEAEAGMAVVEMSLATDWDLLHRLETTLVCQ